MIIDEITLKDGSRYYGVPADKAALLALGLSAQQADELIRVALEKEQTKERRFTVRQTIGEDEAAGDTESILGTTNDITLYLLQRLAQLARAHAQGKEATDRIMTALAAELAPFLEASVRLPHQVKGTGTVIEDAQTRGMAIATVLASLASPETAEATPAEANPTEANPTEASPAEPVEEESDND